MPLRQGSAPIQEIEIRETYEEATLEGIRVLFREYQAMIGNVVCFQDFQAEVQSLPGRYAPPRGCLVHALVDGRLAGVVALRGLAPQWAEVKRLYVRPEYRSLGIGRRLMEAVLERAQRLEFQRVVLDTLPSMLEAHRLYQRIGFHEIEAYYEDPVPGTRFFEYRWHHEQAEESTR